MINMDVDTAQITRLKAKFEKYGPYAIKRGLEAANDYLNSPDIRAGLYPPREYGPFVWSSDKQRRAYFATNGFGGGIPYMRTMQLYENAKFNINERLFWIEYTNTSPYAKWVQHPSYQIIGMKMRNWMFVNKYILTHRTRIVSEFKPAALKAWKEIDSFMYGGAVGL
jgi:hypothetical protein